MCSHDSYCTSQYCTRATSEICLEIRARFFLSSIRSPENALWICFRIVSEKIPSIFFSIQTIFLLCVIQVAFGKNGPCDDLSLFHPHSFSLLCAFFCALCSISPTHSFVYHPIIIIILSHFFFSTVYITDAPLPLYERVECGLHFYWQMCVSEKV